MDVLARRGRTGGGVVVDGRVDRGEERGEEEREEERLTRRGGGVAGCFCDDPTEVLRRRVLVTPLEALSEEEEGEDVLLSPRAARTICSISVIDLLFQLTQSSLTTRLDSISGSCCFVLLQIIKKKDDNVVHALKSKKSNLKWINGELKEMTDKV